MARNHKLTPEAVRAVRAAIPPEPWLPPGFVAWVVARLFGLALLVGAAWVVYDSASSDRFQVRSVRVQGNVLLSRAEVESAAAVTGANVFWVDRGQVAARLRALALIQRAEISASLPDTVEISIVERQPAAFWVSGDRSYLVDGEGVILKTVDVETQRARACAGQPCDPRLASLPTVAQLDGQPLNAGDRVDAGALAIEWSRDFGLEVPTRDGWRARFDGQRNVDQQVSSLRSIRDELSRTRGSAEVIDVRFGDRPYFR
jgi:cell division septal protein FtsQ